MGACSRTTSSIYSERSTVIGKQRGYYGQYLVGFGPIHLMAAVRRNVTDFTSIVARFGASSTHAATTVPNFGAVVDITDKLSVFGTVAYGYTPTFSLNAAGNKLPDIRSRNAETGVKWDLFDKRVLINASYFSIRQSNLLDRDPANPRFSIALPGQLGEGVDLNISGTPVTALTVSAAFTRTDYKFLQPTPTIGNTLNGQPRDVYNFYASYERKIGDDMRAGLGGGVAGRSSSAIDRLNTYRIAGAALANLNGFLSIGDLDINIGVRNLFDRKSYAPTRFDSYIPLGEPRSWRLTVGYRFF
jgi:iron complex outermembrane recepter protein